MPAWLKLVLLAVGLLAVVTFLTEPLLVARRRHRAATSHAAQAQAQAGAVPSRLGSAPLSGADRPCIILADHPRLVVTCDRDARRVYVLRPPGADPRVILRVARVVLPEGPYGELAKQLGLPAIGPVD
jgi:hypothetical protein